ncbi:MAG: AI-2E family transporter [Nanoarchaeota archaeon]|nr:AI-2E family transporter [Nanoarchaeota archaeon]
MLKPVLIPIVLSAIVAYVSYPLYKKIQHFIKSQTWSALIVSVLILIIIAVPLIFLLNSLIMQTQVVYTMSRKIIVTGGILGSQCQEDGNVLCSIISPLQEVMADPKTKYYLDDALKGVSSSFIDQATNFIFAIPKRVLEFFIMLFTVFYLLKDGPRLVKWIRDLLPINHSSSKLLLRRMKRVLSAMIYGYFFIAIMQGVLGGIGFFIVGIPSALFWGILMGIAGLIPMAGTAIIWVPASLLLILNGFIGDNNIEIWKGIGLFLYGSLIVSTIDNFVRPKIVSTRANIHPVLVLLGIVGGVQIFGFVGLLIGPIILCMMVTLLCMYKNIPHEKNESKTETISTKKKNNTKKGRK